MWKSKDEIEKLNRQGAQSIPFDGYTFLIEIPRDGEEMELPPGSLCVFQGGEEVNQCRQGDLILVQRPVVSGDLSYSIERLALKNENQSDVGSSKPSEIKLSDERSNGLEHTTPAIVGRFVCVLE